MTYFAPRQGLFAVIILVSLVLHVLFFVISQEYEQNKQQYATAQREALLIAEEIAIPLNSLDRVSISIIANRYLNHDNIDFIGVYDSEDNLIVPVGKESPDPTISTETITLKNQVLGKVAVHTHTVNRAQIISRNWLFLASIFVIHIILWLAYGYVARPSKNMLTKIAEDMRLRLLSSNILPDPPDTSSEPVIAPTDRPELTPTDKTDKTNQTDKTDKEKHNHNKPSSTPNKPVETPYNKEPIRQEDKNYIAVQIRFDDNNELLHTLSQHTKLAYFSLCTQLLTRATHELLKLPVIGGVSLLRIDDYNDNGAMVILQADNPHGKTATAGVMLARLMIILNQIVYDKHRELKRFALPIRTMVSNLSCIDEILAISKKHRERVLILVSELDLIQLNTYVVLDKLHNPTTINEHECRWLKSVTDPTAERLEKLRNAVLLSE